MTSGECSLDFLWCGFDLTNAICCTELFARMLLSGGYAVKRYRKWRNGKSTRKGGLLVDQEHEGGRDVRIIVGKARTEAGSPEFHKDVYHAACRWESTRQYYKT
jgi:hypothetical protein